MQKKKMQKKNQGRVSVDSGSISRQVRDCDNVQPTDSLGQSMTNNRNGMENESPSQHKRRKTNRGVIRVDNGSGSSQVRDLNCVQPTYSTGQSMTEDGSSYGSSREDITSK
jgi:hypothetical protein